MSKTTALNMESGFAQDNKIYVWAVTRAGIEA